MSIISRSSGLLKLVSISQLALRVFALVFFCQIESLPANAQDYLLQTGVPPFTVESPVEFGFVNLANGNLHLEIPLDSFPQRGGHPLSAAFFYDSRFWQAVNNTMQPVNYTGYQHELVQWRFVTSADPGKRGGYSSKTYSCGGTFGGTRTNYYNFRWIFPDGSTKSFPGTSTWYVDPNCAKDGYKATPTSRAQAGDASGYLMVVNSYYSPTVYGPDGTQVGTDTCCSIQNPIDTNGNYVSDASFSDPTKVDTLDRKPFVVTNSCNGNSNQICYDILNSQGTTYRVTVTTESISVSTNFQNPATDYSGTITVIQSIALPNGTSYNFAYDSGTTPGHYGELTGITLPTGGQITYGYSVFTDSLYQSQYRKNEWVTSRTSGSGTWNYTPLVVSACTTITSTNCQQQTTVAQPSGDNIVYQFTLTGSSSGGVGLTQVQAYAGAVSPANLTKTVSGTWNTAYTQKLSETVTVPVPGGSSISQTKQYAYDNNNDQNVSQLSEWKFYTGSLPATADRITSTTYTQANSSYATKNILNKPTSVVVKTGGGTQLAQTNYVYDSMGLISLTGAFNHDDANYGTNNIIRGNLTQVQRWVGGNGYLTTTMTYDTTGQLRSVQDPASNTTNFSYSDNFFTDAAGVVAPGAHTAPALTNAYLTQVSLPVSGSITYGYYYGTGKVASQKDQNQADNYLHYLDSIDRLTLSFGPILPSTKRPWSLTNYTSATQIDSYVGISDATAAPSCTSCKHNQRLLDNLGRLTTQELVSDPDGATLVTTNYDATGRVQSKSHPYRSTSDSTYGLETSTYDVLWRVTKITHPDGTHSQVFYGAAVAGSGLGGVSSQLCSGTTYGIGYPTLAIDESGKKRENWTDGFAHLIEIDEPDSNGNLAVATCYQYDLLGNLLAATRGTQVRSYTYDPMSRVSSATFPEQAVGTSGTTNFYYTNSSGALCSGDQKQVCRRLDPRAITTTYSYDALYRQTGKSYSDSTPAVTYTTDQTNCGSAALSNGVGRVTGMSVADGSSSALWCYDSAGHLITDKQTLRTVSKTISYAYNSDGSLASITYPSGRTVTYNVGNAGRPLSATDLANSINYAAAVTYGPPAGLASIVYGGTSPSNGIPEQIAYNNRLQLSAVTDGPSVTNYSYNLNGAVNSFTNSLNPSLGESFGYDSLDRIVSAATQGASGPGCWGQVFGTGGVPEDAYSNLNQISVSQCSAGSLSVGVDGNDHIVTGGYAYDGGGNMTQDGSGIAYTYDAENRITSANGVNYSYDGNGLRVTKSNGTLYWRSVGGSTLAESDLNGNITSEYIFFWERRIARRDSSGNVFYYFTDALGTTTGVVDAAGNPCYEASYTPYGQEIVLLNTCPQNYKFTGFERDAETGLDYAFARYYNSRIGRFMSVDPSGGDLNDPQSLNRYAYVLNNPTNRTDPFGLWSHYDDYFSRQGVASNPYTKRACFLDGAEAACEMVFDLMAKGDAFQCPQSCTGLKLSGDVWYRWSKVESSNTYTGGYCSDDGTCSYQVYQDIYIHFQYLPFRNATSGEYVDAELQSRSGSAGANLGKLINGYEHAEHPFLNVVVSMHLAGAGAILTVAPWLAFPEECAGTGGLGCGVAAAVNTTVSAGGLALIYGAYKFTVEETIPSFRHGHGRD